MDELTGIKKTLLIPLKGRVYASIYQSKFFYDKKAVEIYNTLDVDEKILDKDEYSYLASANRSKRMDIAIKNFLMKHPLASIINLGCGLEDIMGRNDNGKANFFEIDFKEVIELRKKYFSENKRDHLLAYDIFDLKWMDEVRSISNEPVLIVAAGLLYFFKEGKVLKFLNDLTRLKPAEVIFDMMNTKGMKIANKKMKKLGSKEELIFAVDNVNDFVNDLNCHVSLITEDLFFSNIDYKSYFTKTTKLTMKLSDHFKMQKIIRLSIN